MTAVPRGQETKSGLEFAQSVAPAGRASRLAVLLVAYIWPICSLLAPCDPGAGAPAIATASAETGHYESLGSTAHDTGLQALWNPVVHSASCIVHCLHCPGELPTQIGSALRLPLATLQPWRLLLRFFLSRI